MRTETVCVYRLPGASNPSLVVIAENIHDQAAKFNGWQKTEEQLHGALCRDGFVRVRCTSDPITGEIDPIAGEYVRKVYA